MILHEGTSKNIPQHEANCDLIHPLLTVSYSQPGSWTVLESPGERQEYTQDRSPVHHMTHTHSHQEAIELDCHTCQTQLFFIKKIKIFNHMPHNYLRFLKETTTAIKCCAFASLIIHNYSFKTVYLPAASLFIHCAASEFNIIILKK